MSFNIQQQIKNNAADIRQYVNDLYEWEHQKEAQDKAKKSKGQKIKQSQVVHKPEEKSKQEDLKTNEEFKKLKRDVNTVSDYYKAWDKFDVDAEVDKVQKEGQANRKPYNPYQNSLNNIRAKPKTQMTVKGGRGVVRDPTSLKDRGNLHFKTNEYQKAVECYTQCLDKLKNEPQTKNTVQLKCIVLSNRAMCYLKMSEYSQAYDDSNASLILDPKYVKSYLRRATALKKLKKYREALGDFTKATELDPDSGEAKEEIKRIKAHLSQLAKQARQSMVKESSCSSLKTQRLPIEQIDDKLALQTTTNYLEQL